MSKTIKIIIGIAIFIILAPFLFFTIKGGTPIALGLHKEISTKGGLAIGGYDITTYYGDNPVEKGSQEFTCQYKNARWQFASQENLDKFKKHPKQFAPMYGGHCVKAVGKGMAINGDPTVYKLYHGKLYFFLDRDILNEFDKDPIAALSKCKNKWE